jgi:hypothetical protein
MLKHFACTVFVLAGLLSCKGTDSPATATPVPPVATSLVYTDPTTGTYLLKKNATLSTATHLVLDLIGPSTGTAMGIAVTLSADTTQVAWVDVPAGGTTAVLVQNGSQFNLGSGTPIMKAKTTGNVLVAAVAQKAPTAPVSLNGTTLLQVALELKPGVAQGTVIALTTDAAKCQVLPDTASAPVAIVVTPGILKAQ